MFTNDYVIFANLPNKASHLFLAQLLNSDWYKNTYYIVILHVKYQILEW